MPPTGGGCLAAQTWLDSSNGAVSLGSLRQAVAIHMAEYLTHWRQTSYKEAHGDVLAGLVRFLLQGLRDG